MAIITTKFTGLPAATSLSGTDIINIVGDIGSTPISKKVTLTQLLDWLTESGGISDLNPPLSGSGSPEGVETASPGKTYYDTDSYALWVKHSGVNTNTGWILLVSLT